MKQRTLTKILALVLIGIFVCGIPAFAEGIKARMKNRLPVIKELKAQGIVGEDSNGYLQFVGDKQAKPDIVAAENKDRKTVYAAIAKQQGTTAELVGQRRALQIAKRANKGDWVKDKNGKWIKK